MTQAISTLTWQEQSDSSQPLANYTLAFGTDLVWSFQLPSTYHSAPINPRGVTVDNSQGAGTINLVSAGFTVNILPYSREDIDLSNVSQLITFNFQQTPGQPTIAPYSLPIVFWMKRPSGALQNQLAINTAVQSAIVGSLLGNMQPIINSGFSEWPQGTSITSTVAALYTAEGWLGQTAVANVATFKQILANSTFGSTFAFNYTSAIPSASQIKWGTQLTSVDSAQFRGQQVTFGFDLAKSLLQAGSQLIVSIVTGAGNDENIFTPFTGATTVATQTYDASNFTGRVSITTAGPLSTTLKQLGVLFQYNPGAATTFDTISISRPQFDTGAIAQQFRTVPQMMERDRCLDFFEVLNDGLVANYPFAIGQTAGGTTQPGLMHYKKKRSVPVITNSGTFIIFVNAANIAVASIAYSGIGKEQAVFSTTTAGALGSGFSTLLQDSGGTAQIFINARM